jgi:hypothetical protein
MAFLALLLAGCGTTPNQPIIVHLNESDEQGSRFRTQERQRDVWIAPQATDETLLHEQVVTFVEKPQGWKLPSTIEPNTVSNPDLPLEQGDYDAEILHRQQEMIQDKENQIIKATTDLEELRLQSQKILEEKEERLIDSQRKLEAAQKELSDSAQKRAEEVETERKKQDEMKPKKSWWKFWN